METNATNSARVAEVPATAPPDGRNVGFQNMQPLDGKTSGETSGPATKQWTDEEDALLSTIVQKYRRRNWKIIAQCLKDRTDVQCLHRWQEVLNPEIVKGPWSKEEDAIIIEMVNKYGTKKWTNIAQALRGRIGKQCRERWRNHLNPTINKAAWTEEEEMTLIHAHQIYGNKWVELTKFLPGRSENTIKNHWNSSVKKRLDSYKESGSLPRVGNTNQCLPSTSLRTQHNGWDNNVSIEGVAAEEISERSQGLTAVACSQTKPNMANSIPAQKTTEKGGLIKRLSSSSSYPRQDHKLLEEVTCAVPDISCEASIAVVPSEQNLLHEDRSFGSMDREFISLNLPNTSRHCMTVGDGNQEARSVQLQRSMGLGVSTSMRNINVRHDTEKLVSLSEGDRCRVIFPDARMNGCFSLGNVARRSNINDLNGCTDSLISHSEIQRSKTTTRSFPNTYYPLRSSANFGTSSCRTSLTDHPLLRPAERKLILGGQCKEVRNMSRGTQDSDRITSSCSGFAHPSGSTNYPFDGNMEKVCLPPKPDRAKDASKPAPIKIFGSVISDTKGMLSHVDRSKTVNAEHQNSEALCYKPPRFPSSELPFLSCDLTLPGGDLQQAYSPLGIQQLRMSSMNCSTPYNLFDSQSRNDSPDLVPKSAAKSSIYTPSTLKKRQHDLFSPLQEQRSSKKLDRDINSVLCCTSNVARSDENGSCRASISSSEGALLFPTYSQKKNSGGSIRDKENSDHGDTIFSNGWISEEGFVNANSQDQLKKRTTDFDAMAKVDGDCAIPMVQQLSGVLAQHNLNDRLVSSPDQDGNPTNRAFSAGGETPRNQCSTSLATMSNQLGSSSCSESSSGTILISPTIGERKHGRNFFPVTSVEYAPFSRPPGVTFKNSGNSAGIERCGDTPAVIKKGLESSSAWKTLWYTNSSMPGLRINHQDRTSEEMGHFRNPRERSYDAHALTRRLSEHTASALAEAQEVLASKNPGAPGKEGCSCHQNLSKENSHDPKERAGVP